MPLSIFFSHRTGKRFANRARLRMNPSMVDGSREGTGTYKGERVGSLKNGADTYIDASFNCKKP